MDIHIANTTVELGQLAAQRLVQYINNSIYERGQCSIAVSGGLTTTYLFNALNQPELINTVNWQHIHIYFADERFVPANHPESNYGLAHKLFLANIPIPPANIHRVITEGCNAVNAAENYTKKLPPGTLDVVLLGMGPDGHTASLFPDTDVLKVTNKAVAAVYVPKLGAWRISLTIPTINKAKHVMYLISGESKANVLAHVLAKDKAGVKYPIELLEPQGTIDWFLDADAAKLLPLIGP